MTRACTSTMPMGSPSMTATPKSAPSKMFCSARPTTIAMVSTATPMAGPVMRSEEHTSELQSLMRISYAVFCLKKKNKRENINKIYYIDLHKVLKQTINHTPTYKL